MNILLASAHPYIPQISGVAQSNTHELAVEFIRSGHNVSVLSGLTHRGCLGCRSRLKLKLLSRRYVVDKALGYAVFRSWFPWEVADEVAVCVNADVVVLQSGYPVKIALALGKTKARLFVYLHNVELDDL